jgi:catechol 2,3-dioxygenase
MKIGSLGHVVLKVSNLARSEQFYAGVLGMPVCARLDQGGMKMTFFSLGNHHDLAIAEVAGAQPAAGERRVGLQHVAFCIGTSLAELIDAKAHLEAAGVQTRPIDHGVTNSLYFHDPDGNGLEVYVDVSDAWRADPQQVAQSAPLAI